ncbi:MAG: class IV adenylate cyclase [Halobacteria archaeon]
MLRYLEYGSVLLTCMIEVETKVEADHEEVRERIEKLGGEHVAGKRQVDTYYSAPHRDFGETDEALRVRIENGVPHVTYKGPVVSETTKSRKEIEMEVESQDKIEDLLLELGFEEFETVEKDREVYSLMDATVTLDDVSGLGEFAEIELVSPETQLEEVQDRVLELLDRLGFDEDEVIEDTYLKMIVEGERL